MPEFFKTRFPNVRGPFFRRTLLFQERMSIAFADRVLSVNELMADRLVGLGVRPDKLTFIPNSPDLSLFDPTAHPHRAFARTARSGSSTPVPSRRPTSSRRDRCDRPAGGDRPDLDIRLELYGRGDSEHALRAQAAELGIAGRVTFHRRIPLEDVPAAVAVADIGIAPTRLDEFAGVSLSTKVFEYGAMGKAVVASRLPLVERTFAADAVLTYSSGERRHWPRRSPGWPTSRSSAKHGSPRRRPGPRARLGRRG